MARPRIALTPGEPAGIGPDLIAGLAQRACTGERVVVGDGEMLAARARALGHALEPYPFEPTAAPRPQAAGDIAVAHRATAAPVQPGRLDPRNARYVVDTLEQAVAGCLDATFAALVTAPVHKGVINDAGIPFTGHTEFLGARSGGDPVMMLVAERLRVALVTTHLALRDVPAAITADRIRAVARTLDQALRRDFGLARPRIAALGLNPHAGEGGHLGVEEGRIIEPALAELRAEGVAIAGPLPADTAFTQHHLDTTDAVLALYHDQGLPVVKHAGFGSTVNVTLGLPLLRTSVDHGTALDLAATGRAEAGSLAAALDLALALAHGRSEQG
jgi:4-hydroxythreonine-4-phosphate dehydrogenase